MKQMLTNGLHAPPVPAPAATAAAATTTAAATAAVAASAVRAFDPASASAGVADGSGVDASVDEEPVTVWYPAEGPATPLSG